MSALGLFRCDGCFAIYGALGDELKASMSKLAKCSACGRDFVEPLGSVDVRLFASAIAKNHDPR